MKFRKKPVIIIAELFQPDVIPWPDGVYETEKSPTGYAIGTLENINTGHEVTPGDWIITGTHGEKYPCKPDIFKEIYETVDQ